MIEMIVRDLMGTVQRLIITCKSSYCVRSWTTSCPTKLQTGKVLKGGPVEKKFPNFQDGFLSKSIIPWRSNSFPNSFQNDPSSRPPKPAASEPSRSCYRSNAHASGRRFRFFLVLHNKLGHGENSRYDVRNYLAGGLKHFLFSPRKLGKWSNLTNIFQRGWNHHLAMYVINLYVWLGLLIWSLPYAFFSPHSVRRLLHLIRAFQRVPSRWNPPAGGTWRAA